MDEKDSNLYIFGHPLIDHHMMLLRDRNTLQRQYRASVRWVTTALVYEAMGMFPPPDRTETIVCASNKNKIMGTKLRTERIALVSILRAGLLMASTAHDIFPKAPICQIGIASNRDNDEHTRYSRFPRKLDHDQIYIFDSTILSGGSAITALRNIQSLRRKCGIKDMAGVIFIALTVSSEGYRGVNRLFPEIPFLSAAYDDENNKNAAKHSTIGEAGSRIYGTG